MRKIIKGMMFSGILVFCMYVSAFISEAKAETAYTDNCSYLFSEGAPDTLVSFDQAEHFGFGMDGYVKLVLYNKNEFKQPVYVNYELVGDKIYIYDILIPSDIGSFDECINTDIYIGKYVMSEGHSYEIILGNSDGLSIQTYALGKKVSISAIGNDKNNIDLIYYGSKINFTSSPSVKNVQLPYVTEIADLAFSNNYNLENVNIGSSLPEEASLNIGRGAFKGCRSLTSFIYPHGIRKCYFGAESLSETGIKTLDLIKNTVIEPDTFSGNEMTLSWDYTSNILSGTIEKITEKGIKKDPYVDISKLDFNIPAQYYNTQEICPPIIMPSDINVSFNESTEQQPGQFTVTYSNNVDAGKALAVVNGTDMRVLGNNVRFFGTAQVEYTIKCLDINSDDIHVAQTSTDISGYPEYVVYYSDSLINKNNYSIDFRADISGKIISILTGKNNLCGIKNIYTGINMPKPLPEETYTPVPVKDTSFSTGLTQKATAIPSYSEIKNKEAKKAVHVKTAKTKKAAEIKKISKSGKSVSIVVKKMKKTKGYEIYVSHKKNGKYKLIAKGRSNKVTVKKMKAGTYYFKVRAYKKTGAKKSCGRFSTAKKIKIAAPKAPDKGKKRGKNVIPAVKLKIKKVNVIGSSDYIQAKWSDENKKCYFEIERKTGNNKFENISIINNALQSYPENTLQFLVKSTNEKSVYRMRLYKVIKGKRIYGKYSNECIC